MMASCFRSMLEFTFLVALAQINFGCSNLTSNAAKPPDLSLIPKIGPHPEMTQLEILPVSSDFNSPISAKDALKIANPLTEGLLIGKQPEKIKVELVPESKTSNRKIWSVSYWGESFHKGHPVHSFPGPPPLDTKDSSKREVPSQMKEKVVLSVGIDPDTGKSHGIIINPADSWSSWRPPTKEDTYFK